MSAAGEPLAGCVMIVTADRRRAELATALARRGASVTFARALSTVSHLGDDTLLATTRRLISSPPDIVVATTGIGFREWIEAADAAGLGADLLRVLADARLVARGPKALGAIQAAGQLVMRATAAVLDGRVLPLSPTGLEILKALVRADGGVVTRERLAALLPSGSAGSHAVEAAINRLRDNAGSREIVRTVVKRDYALGVSGT